MSTTARSERPIRRWISVVRPSGRPLATSRGFRSPVEPGSIPYSAVTQPRPRPRIQGGTASSTEAVQITRVRPTEIRALPWAVSTKPGRISTGRSWSGAASVGSHRRQVRRPARMPRRTARGSGRRPGGLRVRGRPDRRRHLHRERHPRLPLRRRPVGEVRPDGGGLARHLPLRARALLELPPPAHRPALGRRAQPGPPAPWPSSSAAASCGPWSPRTSTACTRAPGSDPIEVHGALDRGRLPALRRAGEHRRARRPRRRRRGRRAPLRLRVPHEERRRAVRRGAPGRGDRRRLRRTPSAPT